MFDKSKSSTNNFSATAVGRLAAVPECLHLIASRLAHRPNTSMCCSGEEDFECWRRQGARRCRSVLNGWWTEAAVGPQIGAQGRLLVLWLLTFIILVMTIHASAHSIVHTEPTIDATVDVLVDAQIACSSSAMRSCASPAALAQRYRRVPVCCVRDGRQF